MSTAKLIVGSLLAFAIFFVLDFIWYDLVMPSFFEQVEGLYRETPLFPLIIIGMLVFGYAFCASYVKGFKSGKPILAQGISHGILVCLLVFVPMAFIFYAVYSFTTVSESVVDLIYHLVQCILGGIVIANYFGAIEEKPGRTLDGGA